MIESIKKRVIKEFIASHDRAPTQQEVKNIYNQFVVDNPSSESIGIIASNKNTYPIAGKECSAKEMNRLVDDLILDQKQSIKTTKEKINKLEIDFRTFNKKLNNSLSVLRSLERNVNKNLLLHLKEDIYTYGIVESFEDYDKVDFNRSNISFFNSKATVGFTKVSSESFSSNQIRYQIKSRFGNPLLKKEVASSDNILKEDGRFFKTIGYSKYPDDICEMIIDITFPEEKGIEVDTLKFTSLTPEVNSKVGYRCFYSTDLINLTPVFESGLRIKTGENYIEVNKKNVRSIKLILTKHNYDFKENGEFAYVFGLDFIGHTRNSYKINESSVLYLGPYEILDENNSPHNYSMATLKGGTCCLSPDETSIDMYLSRDNVNWIKTDYNGNTKQVVQFEASEESGANLSLVSLVDPSSTSNYLAEVIPEGINLKPNEKLLNTYISSENKEKFIKNSLKIRRNVCNKNSETLYGASPGWQKIENDFYITSFEIKEMSGRYFDFGPNACFINKRQVSGKVFLAKGIHTFKTSTENWHKLDLEKESDINSSRQLKNIDPLYPYNHKYIIEGFGYPRGFRGKKTYKGADSVFVHLLKEVSNQRFNIETGLDVFTIIENENGYYFKIKNKENSSESKIEDFNFSYRKKDNTNGTNKLYIKAILKTFNEKVTPKIEQIQVRVI